MKKNTVKTKVIGTVLAALCAVSAAAAVSSVGVSAASVNRPAAVVTASKKCVMTLKGKNWTYWIDSLNINVSCDFNYSTSTCRFIIKGVKPGVTNAVLKTLRADGKWDNTPVRFTVDQYLNVTGKQTGRMFVTGTRFEG